jgi:hypothetical protein
MIKSAFAEQGQARRGGPPTGVADGTRKPSIWTDSLNPPPNWRNILIYKGECQEEYFSPDRKRRTVA